MYQTSEGRWFRARVETPHLSRPQTRFWRRQWHPTPVLLPGKSHGRRSLVGGSPWGRTESDTTERFHFHFHRHGSCYCSLILTTSPCGARMLLRLHLHLRWQEKEGQERAHIQRDFLGVLHNTPA